MRKVIVMAALAALCACADNDVAEEEMAAGEAMAPAEPLAGDWAGTYEFEMNGVTTIATLNPDGTFTDTQDGEVMQSGTWVERDGKVCFDPAGEELSELCWSGTEPDAEGMFTSTSDDGRTITLKRTS